MDPLFRITDRLPVAPGESPFHFRGFYYDRLISRIRKSPGGLDRLRRDLTDERVSKYLGQRFKWNTWYDALPTLPIYAALARIEGADFEETVLRGARQAAVDLVPRMFRMGLGWVRSPGGLAARVTRIMLHAVDFGRVRFESLDHGGGTGLVSGIPLILAPSVVNVFVGWTEGMLKVGGASQPRGFYSDVAEDGSISGYPTVTARFTFAWQEG